MSTNRKACKSSENKAETMICEYRYKLDAQQQDYIKDNYFILKDILKLTQGCFKDDLLDTNSDEYNNVRKYVVRLRKIEKNEVSEAYNFSDEEIEYIANKGGEMGAFNICKMLFPDRTDNMVRESQTASDIIKALEVISSNSRPVDANPILDSLVGEYIPPQSEIKIMAKINEADDKAELHVSKLDSRKKSYIRALKHNMNSPRFIAIANSIKTKILRNLFEIEFIRATYDKPDLNTEEVNAYISLCNEYVLSAMLSEQLSDLNAKLSEAINTEDRMMFHKNISDSRIAIAKEYNDCQKRINTLQVDLNNKKMERQGAADLANESLSKWVDLVEMEEGRNKLLRLQQARNLVLEKEIKRIESFDELIAEWHGISAEELLNF